MKVKKTSKKGLPPKHLCILKGIDFTGQSSLKDSCQITTKFIRAMMSCGEVTFSHFCLLFLPLAAPLTLRLTLFCFPHWKSVFLTVFLLLLQVYLPFFLSVYLYIFLPFPPHDHTKYGLQSKAKLIAQATLNHQNGHQDLKHSHEVLVSLFS